MLNPIPRLFPPSTEKEEPNLTRVLPPIPPLGWGLVFFLFTGSLLATPPRKSKHKKKKDPPHLLRGARANLPFGFSLRCGGKGRGALGAPAFFFLAEGELLLRIAGVNKKAHFPPRENRADPPPSFGGIKKKGIFFLKLGIAQEDKKTFELLPRPSF